MKSEQSSDIEKISILALVWRATGTPEEVIERAVISILALVWRATSPPIEINRLPLNFNPRPRVEGDCMPSPINSRWIFQSSPSCGGRRDLQRQYRSEREHFNPRPRVEGDFMYFVPYFIADSISILALVWRATTVRLHNMAYRQDFNPRPRVEGDTPTEHR